MRNSAQHRSWTLNLGSSAAIAALAIAIVFALTGLSTQSAQAQTYTVLHNFTSGSDGSAPGELTMDAAGNLYGTGEGGTDGSTAVFELKHAGDGWILKSLKVFRSGNEGGFPGPVVLGPDGNLYGTAKVGGSCQVSQYGCGLVFKLAPPPTACNSASCPWVETVLYDFAGGSDGVSPIGPLTFGPDGSIYGITWEGGYYDDGTVYKLTPSNGGWTESVLYSFTGGSDGQLPEDGVTLDQAGNLYGVTEYGGLDRAGVVFELSPSGSGWTFRVLHYFGEVGDGAFPVGGLIFDQSGNLYGTTTAGPSGGGVVYMLTPNNGGWTETILYDFTGGYEGPEARLNMDATGALYGTTYNDPVEGEVFKLAPEYGGWVETNLYVFNQGNDGNRPASNVLFDASGNLYGSATQGGIGNCEGLGCGVLWKITP